MVWRSGSKKRQCIRWSSSTNRFKTMNRRKRNVSNNFCALSSVYFLPLRVSWNARLTLCFYLILLWTWLIHIYPFYLASDQIFWINMKLFSHSSSTVSTALYQIQDKYLKRPLLLLFRFRATHTRKSPEFTKYFQFDLDALDALDLNALDLDALCSVKSIKYYLMDFVCKGGVWGRV